MRKLKKRTQDQRKILHNYLFRLQDKVDDPFKELQYNMKELKKSYQVSMIVHLMLRVVTLHGQLEACMIHGDRVRAAEWIKQSRR
jgi:hypothetical protein